MQLCSLVQSCAVLCSLVQTATERPAFSVAYQVGWPRRRRRRGKGIAPQCRCRPGVLWSPAKFWTSSEPFKHKTLVQFCSILFNCVHLFSSSSFSLFILFILHTLFTLYILFWCYVNFQSMFFCSLGLFVLWAFLKEGRARKRGSDATVWTVFDFGSPVAGAGAAATKMALLIPPQVIGGLGRPTDSCPIVPKGFQHKSTKQRRQKEYKRRQKTVKLNNCWINIER